MYVTAAIHQIKAFEGVTKKEIITAICSALKNAGDWDGGRGYRLGLKRNKESGVRNTANEEGAVRTPPEEEGAVRTPQEEEGAVKMTQDEEGAVRTTQEVESGVSAGSTTSVVEDDFSMRFENLMANDSGLIVNSVNLVNMGQY